MGEEEVEESEVKDWGWVWEEKRLEKSGFGFVILFGFFAILC